MPRQKTEKVKFQAVAYLLGQEKAPRDKIAEKLGISLATVFRAIQQAKEEGWLEITHRFVADKFSPEEIKEIKRTVSPTIDMQKKVDEFLKEKGPDFTRPIVRVFNVLQSEDESERESFSRTVTNDIKELIFQSNICGISWGYTLANIIEYLQTPEMRPSGRRDRNIQFMPVCGESIDGYLGNEEITEDHYDMTSSTGLALQLSRVINIQKKNNNKPNHRDVNLSLRAVPALIPMEFDNDKVDVIKDFIENIRSYRKIFLEDPLIERMDTLITSVGSIGGPTDMLKYSFARSGGINLELIKQLKEIVSGDIAGFAFRKENLEGELKHKQDEFFSKLEYRWTGIKYRHIEDCARRASSNGKPGVIVVAMGKEKAQSVYQGIKNGLINKLFIDEKLSKELIKLITGK